MIHDEEEEKHDEQSQDKLMYADSQSQLPITTGEV